MSDTKTLCSKHAKSIDNWMCAQFKGNSIALIKEQTEMIRGFCENDRNCSNDKYERCSELNNTPVEGCDCAQEADSWRE